MSWDPQAFDKGDLSTIKTIFNLGIAKINILSNLILFKEIVYTYLMDVSGIAHLLNPRQGQFPEGSSYCQGFKERAFQLRHRIHVLLYWCKYIYTVLLSIQYHYINFYYVTVLLWCMYSRRIVIYRGKIQLINTMIILLDSCLLISTANVIVLKLF